jgi:hypothetical protein
MASVVTATGAKQAEANERLEALMKRMETGEEQAYAEVEVMFHKESGTSEGWNILSLWGLSAAVYWHDKYVKATGDKVNPTHLD